ncbi:hypothetical protein F2Q70_00012214 [Brassica cretica]|uniref:Pentatricopeptide repeat-containing protein n=1 Tax=Brassica cretica TaxID=69181 RepID=A0A8S9M668_BRACR|nr:hypothetical protein F2Q70_00012214 [Brassica cretica]
MSHLHSVQFFLGEKMKIRNLVMERIENCLNVVYLILAMSFGSFSTIPLVLELVMVLDFGNESMWISGCHKKSFSCSNAMAASYMQNGFHVEAIKLFYQMKVAGIEVYNRLVNEVKDH